MKKIEAIEEIQAHIDSLDYHHEEMNVDVLKSDLEIAEAELDILAKEDDRCEHVSMVLSKYNSLVMELRHAEAELDDLANEVDEWKYVLEVLVEMPDDYEVEIETPFRPGQCKTLVEMGREDLIKKQAEACEGIKKYRKALGF